MDMKLISATCSSLVSHPPLLMAASKSNYKDLLRDIYDSEELKIESERCRALKRMIEELCTRQNTVFLAVFQKLEKEVDVKKKSRLAMVTYTELVTCTKLRDYQFWWGRSTKKAV